MKLCRNLKDKLQQLLKLLKKGIAVIFLKDHADNITSSQNVKEKKESISLEQLNIKVFYNILKNEVITLKKEKISKSNWIDLLDEYWRLVDSDKYEVRLRKTTGYIRKENKITTLTAILVKYNAGYPVGKELKEWKYKSVEAVLQAVRVIKTNLNLEILRDRSNNSNDSEISIYKDLVILEGILNRTIDLENCNVLYWLELSKMAKQIVKEKSKK